MKFTDKVAAYIFENNIDLQHLVIVLPSERAKKYVAASLYAQTNSPMIAPKMVTMDAWIKELSSKRVVDKTRIMIHLYEVYQSLPKGKEIATFDEFLEWGPMLVSDFDEIDRYLVSSKEVFRNLKDIKELESWQVDESELSETRRQFMEFWERLGGYYEELNKVLDSKEICYLGRAYREVAEQIDLSFKEDKQATYLFAGFNAMSAAEIQIIKQLHRLGRGHVIVDADQFYVENQTHEAGRFIRVLLDELGVKTLPYIENKLITDAKRVELVECPQTTGQVKLAASRLAELSPDEVAKTLVLLADEGLITPLLKNIPKHVQKANITLGMPLKSSAVRNWLDIIFSIQENKIRFRTDALYHKDLQRILNHPFIIAILNEQETKAVQQLEKSIVTFNRVFLNPERIDIGERLEHILKTVCVAWNSNWQLAMQQIRSLNDQLYRLIDSKKEFERALLAGFDEAIGDFYNLVNEQFPEMNLRSFRSLFNQHWGRKSISYMGNPIDGLQIMGLLETRLLDFERIICLGMNEGTMPPTNPIQTLLPMDLRRYLQLPTPREKQGLFAHHFYRLLHNSKDLLVTYTSGGEAIGGSEKSRYLLQLELELARINPAFELIKSHYHIPFKHVDPRDNWVPKTLEIVNRLDALFERSLSASALKKFKSCSLDFYYRYVLEFGEEDQVEEEIESSKFGTFVHDVLERLYTPFVAPVRVGERTLKHKLTQSDVDGMLAKAETYLREAYLKHFDNDAELFARGKNRLNFEVALESIRKFLKQEKKLLAEQHELIIESLEEEVNLDVTLNIGGKNRKIHLKGFIDRVDRLDGKLRIIDYKTGVIDEKSVTFNDTSKTKEPWELVSEPKHVLQLLMYSYMYEKIHGEVPAFAGILSLISINHGIFTLEAKSGKTLKEMVAEFPDYLTAILEEIYDPSVPFEHTDSYTNYCVYCD